MSDLLKSVIQDLINDRTEQAQVSIHSYIVAKTQELAGLKEEAEEDQTLLDLIDELEGRFGAAKSINTRTKKKEIQWVTNDTGDEDYIATEIAAELQEAGFTGWTVKVRSRLGSSRDKWSSAQS